MRACVAIVWWWRASCVCDCVEMCTELLRGCDRARGGWPFTGFLDLDLMAASGVVLLESAINK